MLLGMISVLHNSSTSFSYVSGKFLAKSCPFFIAYHALRSLTFFLAYSNASDLDVQLSLKFSPFSSWIISTTYLMKWDFARAYLIRRMIIACKATQRIARTMKMIKMSYSSSSVMVWCVGSRSYYSFLHQCQQIRFKGT